MKTMTPTTAAIFSGILTAYFAFATLILNARASTPADEAAVTVVAIIAGGLGLLAAMLAFEALDVRRAANSPSDGEGDVDYWG